MKLRILITLPLDRTSTGTLAIENEDGATLLNEISVLGKADNAKAAEEGNTNRDPTLPYGDTPTGTYEVPRAIPTGSGTNYSSASFGSVGAIVLNPASGQALEAKNNGRTGLLLHSGKLRDGKLRATHGCLRVSEDSLVKIFEAIQNSSPNPEIRMCEIVELSVIVGEKSSEGAGSDEQDPPLGIDDLISQPGNPFP